VPDVGGDGTAVGAVVATEVDGTGSEEGAGWERTLAGPCHSAALTAPAISSRIAPARTALWLVDGGISRH
jgi:hypothetical protein